MKRKVLHLVAALVVAGTLGACGTGTGKRFLTTPDTYEKLIGFPATGKPLNIDDIVAEYPEMARTVDGKPKIVTAPEYIEEFSQLLTALKAQGIDDKTLIPFKIPAGLQLTIEVIGENISRSYIVGPHGYIDVPMIGEVFLIGKTIREVKNELIASYRKYIQKPEVLVNVQSSPSYTASAAGAIAGTSEIYGGSITLLGAIQGRWSANINFTGRETLVSVIGAAGLPSNAEWRQIRVIRRSQEDPLRLSRIIICDLWNYFAIGDVTQDIPLMPGDVVFVPVKWTLADQFNKDWQLMLGYMNDAFSLDTFREGMRKNGALRD
ncbi:MAG: hypothetical protein A2Z34_01575 [Planctomycetes bacterium RBG_16_59_8]|nr:MAG: hypothetical protein A2Z34_01575 [Planctomycetes bacterium RBG_16_59_8]